MQLTTQKKGKEGRRRTATEGDRRKHMNQQHSLRDEPYGMSHSLLHRCGKPLLTLASAAAGAVA